MFARTVTDNPLQKQAFGSKAWRKAFVRRPAVQYFAGSTVYQFLRFTHIMQRDLHSGTDFWFQFQPHAPAIIAMWHGQHFMVPFMWPKGQAVDALISRNADAEINAQILRKMGVQTIRGSGGRDERQNTSRGGAKALLELRRSLANGRSVAMIADVSHGQPRQAGEGIVTLARISGRPIVPVAYATSKNYIFEKSWDKTTLSLPFGKRSFVIGDVVHVADGDDMTAKQQAVTEALNNATKQAYQNVGLALKEAS